MNICVMRSLFSGSHVYSHVAQKGKRAW